MLTVCIGSTGGGGPIVGVVLWHVITPTPLAHAHISLYLQSSCQRPPSKYVNYPCPCSDLVIVIISCTVLLEYFAGEKPLQMSQISRKCNVAN